MPETLVLDLTNWVEISFEREEDGSGLGKTSQGLELYAKESLCACVSEEIL
jgi:hypothetical protein